MSGHKIDFISGVQIEGEEEENAGEGEDDPSMHSKKAREGSKISSVHSRSSRMLQLGPAAIAEDI